MPVLVDHADGGFSLRAVDLDADVMLEFLAVAAEHDGELRGAAWVFGDHREVVNALVLAKVPVRDQNGDDPTDPACHCGLEASRHDGYEGHPFVAMRDGRPTPYEAAADAVESVLEADLVKPFLEVGTRGQGQELTRMPALQDAVHDTPVADARAGVRAEDAGREALLSDVPLLADVARQGALRLRPYQEDGVKWVRGMWARHGSALLADDPGLGKTAQALMSLPDELPSGLVIVCPAGVKKTWLDELGKFRPDLAAKAEVLYGRKSFVWPSGLNRTVITNREIFPGRFRGCPDGLFVIIDECHAYGNLTQSTQRVRVLVRESKKKGGKTLGLTGSPMWLDPPGLWTMATTLQLTRIAWADQAGEPDYDAFVSDFGAVPNKWGALKWPAEPRDLKAVKTKTSMFTLRRIKTEVLPDLPPMSIQDIPCVLDTKTRKQADQVIRELAAMGLTLEDMVDAEARADKAAAFLDEKRKGEFTLEEWKAARQRLLGLLAEAREALVRAKLPSVLEFIADNYEATGTPVVVFSMHRIAVEAMAKRPGWEGILGGIAKGERQRILSAFEAGAVKWLAATIRSVGIGINELKVASHGVFVDFDWSSESNRQAYGRLWRMGQKNAVLIRRFVADHDLDRRVLEILDVREKRNQAVFG